MNIFVMEDDFMQQARIEKIITKLLEKHNIVPKKFEISGKPHQLLQAIEEKGVHQLFLPWTILTKSLELPNLNRE